MTDKTVKRQVDLSQIDIEDRSYVKEIIRRVVKFHDPPCDMDIRAINNDDHYNIAFIGWDQTIDDEKWYRTFLKTDGLETRENVFDMVISTHTVPVADAEESEIITGPIKLFRIKRSGFGAMQKRRK